MLEYSKSQQSYNICTMDEMIKRNIKSMIIESENDWFLLGVFGSYEKASQEMKVFSELIDQRQRA